MVKAGEIEYATLAYLAGEKIAAKYLTLNQASETVYDVLNGGRVVDHIVKDGNGWKDSKGHSGGSPLAVLDQLTYVAKRNGAMDYKSIAYLAGEETESAFEEVAGGPGSGPQGGGMGSQEFGGHSQRLLQELKSRLQSARTPQEKQQAHDQYTKEFKLLNDHMFKYGSVAYLAGEETQASIESEALFGFPTFDPQGAADDYEKWKYFHDHEHDKRPPLGLKDYGPPSGPGMTDKEKTDFKRDWDRSKKSIKILAFGAPSGDQGFLNSVADKLVSVYHEDPEAEYIQLLRKGRGDKKFLDWVAYRFIQHHGVKADVELVNSLQNHAG